MSSKKGQSLPSPYTTEIAISESLEVHVMIQSRLGA